MHNRFINDSARFREQRLLSEYDVDNINLYDQFTSISSDSCGPGSSLYINGILFHLLDIAYLTNPSHSSSHLREQIHSRKIRNSISCPQSPTSTQSPPSIISSNDSHLIISFYRSTTLSTSSQGVTSSKQKKIKKNRLLLKIDIDPSK